MVYIPQSVQLRLVKVSAATVDGVAQVDIKIPDDEYVISGGMGFFANQQPGDWVDIQVVDIDNILGAGAGFVARSFSDNNVAAANKGWFLPLNSAINVHPLVSNDPSDLVKDLYLRIIATKADTQQSDTLYVNYEWGKRLR